MFTPKEMCGIIINVLFVATFLSIFYFTYAAKVEGEIVQAQVDYIVTDFANTIKLFPEGVVKVIREKVASATPPDLSEEDKAMEKANGEIIKKTAILIIILWAMCFGGVFYASKKYKFNVVDIIKDNLIILAFIGITEFIFLNVFGRNFISADPNYVKLGLLNSVTNSIPQHGAYLMSELSGESVATDASIGLDHSTTH